MLIQDVLELALKNDRLLDVLEQITRRWIRLDKAFKLLLELLKKIDEKLDVVTRIMDFDDVALTDGSSEGHY